jgi:hypothetical protein
MSQLLVIGSLVIFLVILSIMRLRTTPKRGKRWMPDIRRVV